jgi:hypothetical protein
MAITVLYEQHFAAGASTFCSPRLSAGSVLDFYESGSNSAADAQDPLYPDMHAAEAVTVLTGGGPEGQNRIDLAVTPGNTDDYSTAGAWSTRGLGVTASGVPITIEVWCKANATSIADNVEGPIFSINRYISGPSMIELYHAKYGGQQHLGLSRASLWGGGVGINDDSYILTDYEDVWVRFQLVVLPSSAAGVADGYYKVYVQKGIAGTNDLVYDKTGLIIDKSPAADITNNTPETTAPMLRFSGAQLGYFGMFGSVASFRIYIESEESETIDPPPIDTSTPCPCPSAPGGGLDTVPNPIGDLPPWVAMCEGGCGVDSVADVAVGEVWL